MANATTNKIELEEKKSNFIGFNRFKIVNYEKENIFYSYARNK